MRTVFFMNWSHSYIRRLAALMELEGFDCRPSPSMFAVACRHRRAILHLQWVEPVLRRDGFRLAYASVKWLAGLLGLKLRAVAVVWTCHNAVGKGHQHTRLDRLLRTATVLAASAVVVHSRGAVRTLEREVYRPARRKVERISRFVPIPISAAMQYGPPLSKAAARKHLRIESSVPVIAYLRGLNQSDCEGDIIDPVGRYRVISVDRAARGERLDRVPHGWQYRGVPDDATYRLLISASDAIVITDRDAFGSLTVCAAMTLRRPVIGPRSPALCDIEHLECVFLVDDGVSSESIALAVPQLSWVDEAGYRRYAEMFADDVTRAALADVYGALA